MCARSRSRGMEEPALRKKRNNTFLAVTVTVRQEDGAVSGCWHSHF